MRTVPMIVAGSLRRSLLAAVLATGFAVPTALPAAAATPPAGPLAGPLAAALVAVQRPSAARPSALVAYDFGGYRWVYYSNHMVYVYMWDGTRWVFLYTDAWA